MLSNHALPSPDRSDSNEETTPVINGDPLPDLDHYQLRSSDEVSASRPDPVPRLGLPRPPLRRQARGPTLWPEHYTASNEDTFMHVKVRQQPRKMMAIGMDRRERGPTFPDNYVCKPLTEKFVFSEVRDMYLKLGLGAIDEAKTPEKSEEEKKREKIAELEELLGDLEGLDIDGLLESPGQRVGGEEELLPEEGEPI